MKDPAFLFYSKDFYEGTRTMHPEERACYVDLMIFQHQNGIIPDDIKKLQMYCSGCSPRTIENVLNQKFNHMVDQTSTGWLNTKLSTVIEERVKFRPKKIASATLAGLISATKIEKNIVAQIKKNFVIENYIYDGDNLIDDEQIIREKVRNYFNHMVERLVNNSVVDHMVDNIANANANAINFNSFSSKGGVGENENPPKNRVDFSLLENRQWFESILRYFNHRITMSQLMEHWKQFQLAMETDDDLYRDLRDYRSHFRNWTAKQLDKNGHEPKSSIMKPKGILND